MLNKERTSVCISYLEILNWDWLNESECVIKFVQAKKQGISISMYSGWKSAGEHCWLRSYISAQKCQHFQLWKPSPLNNAGTFIFTWFLEEYRPKKKKR